VWHIKRDGAGSTLEWFVLKRQARQKSVVLSNAAGGIVQKSPKFYTLHSTKESEGLPIAKRVLFIGTSSVTLALSAFTAATLLAVSAFLYIDRLHVRRWYVL